MHRTTQSLLGSAQPYLTSKAAHAPIISKPRSCSPSTVGIQNVSFQATWDLWPRDRWLDFQRPDPREVANGPDFPLSFEVFLITLRDAVWESTQFLAKHLSSKKPKSFSLVSSSRDYGPACKPLLRKRYSVPGMNV